MVFSMMMCTHDIMQRYMHRPTQILKAPGRMSLCHNVNSQYLHGGWFFVILELCLSATGVSLSAQSPSSVGSMLVDPGLNSSCYFGGELGTLSGQPSVGQLTGNASLLYGIRVGVQLCPFPPTELSHSSCSSLLLMGKR